MHNAKNVDECGLCFKGLYSQAHELLAELHCKSNHFFHQRCLQASWNSDFYNTSRCPLGDNKPYDMPGNAGITPEEQNVFDFDDPAKAERQEREKLDESGNWVFNPSDLHFMSLRYHCEKLADWDVVTF